MLVLPGHKLSAAYRIQDPAYGKPGTQQAPQRADLPFGNLKKKSRRLWVSRRAATFGRSEKNLLLYLTFTKLKSRATQWQDQFQ
jgi:hypothetical protein